jgi:hypothetical protein
MIINLAHGGNCEPKTARRILGCEVRVLVNAALKAYLWLIQSMMRIERAAL